MALCIRPLSRRWQEEAADRRVLVVADWPEIRDLSARRALSNHDLLAALRTHGAGAIVVSQSTLAELWTHQQLLAPTTSLDVPVVGFLKASDAQRVLNELKRHGVDDVIFESRAGAPTLRRMHGYFQALADIEIGWDRSLIDDASSVGLSMMARVNHDPWMLPRDVAAAFDDARGIPDGSFVLFNADDFPGGADMLPWWRSWVSHHGIHLPIFEFHPSKASWLAAKALPTQAFRAHTIPSLELKDLSPGQQQSRWRRAVDERGCRLLLVHALTSDSLDDYLNRLQTLTSDLTAREWVLGPPALHLTWRSPSRLITWVRAILAVVAAIVFPWIALRLAMRQPPKRSLPNVAGPSLAFAKMVVITMLGGCVVAALAQNPDTRLELVPFRGIKVAFVLSWVGSLGFLYSWDDLTNFLKATLRRRDLLLFMALAGVVGYVVVRSGNASSGWKVSSEQALRDQLEDYLRIRPRFKEFMIGHPLMMGGLFLHYWRTKWDARPWIWLGMLGQVSMINTFCHIHSPLRLAILRCSSGALLGWLFGLALIAGLAFVRREKL